MIMVMTICGFRLERMTRVPFVCCGTLAPTTFPQAIARLSACCVVFECDFVLFAIAKKNIRVRWIFVWKRDSNRVRRSINAVLSTRQTHTHTLNRWVSIWRLNFLLYTFSFISIVWFSRGAVHFDCGCAENDSCGKKRPNRIASFYFYFAHRK